MEQPQVFVVGDSISAQYGPYLQDMLQGTFAYRHKQDMPELLAGLDHPRGAHCGDSSLVRELFEVLGAQPDFVPALVLLNCGLHDIKTDPATGAKQVELDEFRRNLRGICGAAKRAAWSLVWVRTTPVDDVTHNSRSTAFHRFAADVAAYNEAADAIMREYGVPLCDLHAFTQRLDGALFCDHVHFHETVRRLQAAFLCGFVYAILQP